MTKFVPYEKLSKKEKKELNTKKRNVWYGLNPITRKPENSHVYNRSKEKAQERIEFDSVPISLCVYN